MPERFRLIDKNLYESKRLITSRTRYIRTYETIHGESNAENDEKLFAFAKRKEKKKKSSGLAGARAFRKAATASLHFRTFVRERKKSAAAAT